MVYDASAKTGTEASLNESLLVGPKFNQLILEILVRFRTYPIGLVADIEKAFLMVGIHPKDQDVLCFLWLKDYQKDSSFTRVVFGVASSPF